MLWGIVIIPVVMQPDWFKQFAKVTYIYLFIPAGSIPEWPSNMHKARKIGIYFPFLRHQPWDLTQGQFMGRLGSTLSALHRTDSEGGGGLLRQFWCACNCIATIKLGLVRTLLSEDTWHKLLGVSRKRSGYFPKPQ